MTERDGSGEGRQQKRRESASESDGEKTRLENQQQPARAKRARDESEARALAKKAKLSQNDLCLNDDMGFVEPDCLEQQPMSIEQGRSEDDLCLEGNAKEVFAASTAQQTKLADQGPSLDEEMTDHCLEANANQGLAPQRVASGKRVTGENKRQLRRENKAKRQRLQAEQDETVTHWIKYTGDFELPPAKENPKKWRNSMCPRARDLALHHPAAETLLQYATGGCPCNTGKPWTKERLHAAVKRGPHASALVPDAVEQLHQELAEKERVGQCKIILWDDIKDNPPKQMKVSPIAMIPHKSRKYRAILDLSFRLRLKDGGVIPSVNENTTLEAPAGAIDQMGHALSRIIHIICSRKRMMMPRFSWQSLISRTVFRG
jgi:hypothetical protein